MTKNVLVLCTGNGCRSIIAEALINSKFGDQFKAYSSGVDASGKVNPNAKKVLQFNNIWRDEYYSKNIKSLLHNDFDLVVTVCDNAKKTCPIFPGNTKVIHMGFDDPDGKNYEAFELCFEQIKNRLLPLVKSIFE